VCRVGEEAALQQRIVGDIDARHEVAGVEGDLFRFGEVVLRIAVQGEQADRAHRGELFGHELRRVEQVDAFEGLVLGVGHDLEAELPSGAVAAFDGVGEVASVEVGVEAVDHLGLFPQQRVDAVLGFPMELHQRRLARRRSPCGRC
jgi:hypothetical protein